MHWGRSTGAGRGEGPSAPATPASSARRPALLALGWLLLAGCSLIDPGQPAPYLCARDGGAADQCPGGWRCGYAGFCLDPAVPATYACASDGDCVGGWACGLDGTCLDPGAPRAFRCLTDHDCAGGWHCGVLQLCYDRTLASAVGCRAEVPLDCAPGWRCGLNQKCHDTDAGAPYACGTDADCERGWRCGPDQVCLDASGDALRPTDALPAPTTRVVDTALPAALPDAIAAAQVSLTVCDAGVVESVDAVVHGDRLTRLQRYQATVPRNPLAQGGLPLACPAGAVQRTTPMTWAERFEVTLPGPGVRALALDGPTTWVVGADGGLYRAVLDRTTGVTDLQVKPVPLDVTSVSVTGHPEFPVVVTSSTAVAAGLPDGGWDLAPPLPAGAGPPISAFAANNFNGNPQGLAAFMEEADNYALYVSSGTFSQRATSDWVHSGQPCSWRCAGGQRARQQLQHSYGPFSSLVYLVLDCADPTPTSTGLEWILPGGACNLLDRGVVPPGAGGPLVAPLRFKGPDRFADLVADALGGFWQFNFSPEVLSGVPAASMGPVAAPLVRVPETATLVGPVAQGHFRGTGLGFVAVGSNALLESGVDGRPTWGVFSSGGHFLQVVETSGDPFFEVRGLDVRAQTTGSVGTAGGPVRAAAPPPAPDGGEVLLVTADDALYAAELTPHGQSPLQVVLVPQPRASLTAVLALPPGPGASHASAYVIASGRVYRVRADNPVVWLADEVRLGSAEAVSLWKDGARVRVGYRDGSVYGLPSGTLLASPIVPGVSLAVDFAGVCGHSFLATSSGLYQLVATAASPVGRWRAVALAASGARAQPLGRLQTDGQGLLVYRERGVVERLEGLSCLP